MKIIYVHTYPLLSLEDVPDSTTLPNVGDEIELESPRTHEVGRYRVANRVWTYGKHLRGSPVAASYEFAPSVAIILTR